MTYSHPSKRRPSRIPVRDRVDKRKRRDEEKKRKEEGQEKAITARKYARYALRNQPEIDQVLLEGTPDKVINNDKEPKTFTDENDRSFQVHAGNRSFPPKFSQKFWELAEAEAKQAGTSLKCAKCGERIRKNNRSIDHKKPWSILKTGIVQHDVCKMGTVWKIVKQTDVMKVVCDGSPNPEEFNKLSDRPNLVPMHRSCNSSKGGSKDTDPVIPVRVRTEDHEPHPGAPCPKRFKDAS